MSSGDRTSKSVFQIMKIYKTVLVNGFNPKTSNTQYDIEMITQAQNFLA